MIAWRISRIIGSTMTHVLLLASNRENAKSQAAHVIGGDPDYYICEPLTKVDEDVWFIGKVI